MAHGQILGRAYVPVCDRGRFPLVVSVVERSGRVACGRAVVANIYELKRRSARPKDVWSGARDFLGQALEPGRYRGDEWHARSAVKALLGEVAHEMGRHNSARLL